MEIKAQERDENFVQGTVQKPALNSCSESKPNPTAAQEAGALLPFPRRESSHRAVLWSDQGCHQPQAGRQILTTYTNQKTEVDLPVFRHLPQKLLLTVYHGSQPLCWQQSHHPSASQVPSRELHAQHALLQSPVTWKNVRIFYKGNFSSKIPWPRIYYNSNPWKLKHPKQKKCWNLFTKYTVRKSPQLISCS